MVKDRGSTSRPHFAKGSDACRRSAGGLPPWTSASEHGERLGLVGCGRVVGPHDADDRLGPRCKVDRRNRLGRLGLARLRGVVSYLQPLEVESVSFRLLQGPLIAKRHVLHPWDPISGRGVLNWRPPSLRSTVYCTMARGSPQSADRTALACPTSSHDLLLEVFSVPLRPLRPLTGLTALPVICRTKM